MVYFQITVYKGGDKVTASIDGPKPGKTGGKIAPFWPLSNTQPPLIYQDSGFNKASDTVISHG